MKRKVTMFTRNKRRVALDQKTLRFVANELMSAHKFLSKHAATPAHGYICAKSWAECYRYLASQAK